MFCGSLFQILGALALNVLSPAVGSFDLGTLRSSSFRADLRVLPGERYTSRSLIYPGASPWMALKVVAAILKSILKDMGSQ